MASSIEDIDFRWDESSPASQGDAIAHDRSRGLFHVPPREGPTSWRKVGGLSLITLFAVSMLIAAVFIPGVTWGTNAHYTVFTRAGFYIGLLVGTVGTFAFMRLPVISKRWVGPLGAVVWAAYHPARMLGLDAVHRGVATGAVIWLVAFSAMLVISDTKELLLAGEDS